MPASNHPNANVNHAGALIRSGRSSEAILLLDAFLLQQPSDVWALAERGRAKSFAGDHQGAIQDFTDIVRLSPDSATSFTGRGNIHAMAGNVSAAIHDFTSAIALDPTNADAYFWRGRLQVERRQLELALQDFTAVIQRDTQGVSSGLLNRGTTHHLLGDFTAAIEDLTKALELEPAVCVHTSLYRGRARQCAGDLAGAISDFTMAIDTFPQLTNAYRHRAEAWEALGDISKAAANRTEYKRLGGADLPAFVLPGEEYMLSDDSNGL